MTTPAGSPIRSEFENIIVRSDEHGGALRLKDVARVELGSKDYAFLGDLNGSATVPIGVYLQPGANALEVAAAVKQTDGRTGASVSPKDCATTCRSTRRASSRSRSRR